MRKNNNTEFDQKSSVRFKNNLSVLSVVSCEFDKKMEMFEKIAYIMANHADPGIPDTPEEWLDNFNTFSIYQILPKLIELWGLNVQTDVQSKKNLDRLTGK